MSSWNESEPIREFDREAVVAIQGGGVYGLSMLGQLSAVVATDITPIALAGTSTGAVIAVLFWAGYSPKDIREMFVKLASNDPARRETLVDLVGPFGDSPLRYDYHRFQRVATPILAYIRQFARSADDRPPNRTALWSRLGLVKRVEILAGQRAAPPCGYGGLLFLDVGRPINAYGPLACRLIMGCFGSRRIPQADPSRDAFVGHDGRCSRSFLAETRILFGRQIGAVHRRKTVGVPSARAVSG